MYWYSDKKAKESRNFIELSLVVKYYPRKESQFVLVMKNEKCYCFKG